MAESQFASSFQGDGAGFGGVGAEEPVGDGDIAFLADGSELASEGNAVSAASLADSANRGDGSGGQGFQATRDGEGGKGIFRAQLACELQQAGFNAEGDWFGGVGRLDGTIHTHLNTA